MKDIIIFIIVLVVIDALLLKHSKIYKFIRSIFIDVVRLNISLIKSLHRSIKDFYWDLRFKGYKNIEQVRDEINRMRPREFEIFCSRIYKNLGYSVRLTPNGNDYGRDVIIKDDEGITTYIECKRWRHNGERKVGREICEKLIGACAAFNVKKGIIINTGDYNHNAYEYTERVNKTGNFELELYSTEDLIRLYKQGLKYMKKNELLESD